MNPSLLMTNHPTPEVRISKAECHGFHKTPWNSAFVLSTSDVDFRSSSNDFPHRHPHIPAGALHENTIH